MPKPRSVDNESITADLGMLLNAICIYKRNIETTPNDIRNTMTMTTILDIKYAILLIDEFL